MPAPASIPEPATVSATADSSARATPSAEVACQVCREDVAVADTVALSACGHRFCVVCITGFLSVRIQDGDVALWCFHEDGELTCGATIDDADIEALVTPETLAKHRRFRLLQSTPQARSCPFCEHTQVTTASVDAPGCVCEGCGQTYCFTHGNAHSDGVEPCAQYEKQLQRTEKRSGRKVKKISRPCPSCTRPIERNGGCPHMTCRVCKAQFCWHCGATWGFDSSEHTQLLSLDSCAGTTEAMAPWMGSSNVWCRAFGTGLHYLFLFGIGWPLTLALCWAWIPYTIVKENCAIAKRGKVLARCFAISVPLAIIVFVGVTGVLIFEVFEGLFDCAKKGIKKLRELRRRGCCRPGCCQPHVTEKTDDATNFTALQDPELPV